MTDRSKLKAEIERCREDLRESVREGSDRVQKQWRDLEEQWADFVADARFKETGEGLEVALRRLGDELVQGYARVREAIKKEKDQPPPLTPEQRRRAEQLAHELWVGRGRPEGSPEVDWEEAVCRVRAEERAVEVPTA